MRIEDYALIGDLQTSALVGRNGSVDWLCLPRFDSASCFTALLGEEKHGRWLIAPAGEVRGVSRRYREGTLVLETDFATADGAARVIDFMPPRDGGAPQLVRIVQGLRGRVPMRMELIVRFGYGLSVPWVQRVPGGIVAQAGPDAVQVSTPVELRGENLTTVAELTVGEGASERFVLSWFPSYESPGRTEDAHAALARTQAWWREWCAHKMRKHFELAITDHSFVFARKTAEIAAEAATDGIYIVRTGLSVDVLDDAATVRSYKSLSQVERAFRCIKTVDLHLRPIYHWLADRVRAHVFLCMLAYYLEWHMRQELAPMLFDDTDKEAAEATRPSVVAPAQRSEAAIRKQTTGVTPDGLPVHSFRTLLADLATLTRNTIVTAIAPALPLIVLARPTPVQRRAYELLQLAL